MSITVQLAHFSDCHSHFDGAPMSFSPVGEGQWRTQCGGYARILTRLTQLRAKAAAAGQRFLFLHGGDSFQGSLYFNRFKGRANADLLAMLAPDAMVLGNHEFDLGNGPLVEFCASSIFRCWPPIWTTVRSQPTRRLGCGIFPTSTTPISPGIVG